MNFDGASGDHARRRKELLKLLRRHDASVIFDPFSRDAAAAAAVFLPRRRVGLFGGEYAEHMRQYLPRAMLAAAAQTPTGVPLGTRPDNLRGSRSEGNVQFITDRQPLRHYAFGGVDEEVYLDRNLAGPNDGTLFIEIGNPENPLLRRAWEVKEGRSWPKDPATGRNYDVGHRKALADGGTNTLDNIEPIHPDDHRAQHRASGDYSRWGKRSSIARAFGGRVVRALPGLDILPIMTGILSGRIRTDNLDNFKSDVLGEPSQEDRRKTQEHLQKQLTPNWKPGDNLVV